MTAHDTATAPRINQSLRDRAAQLREVLQMETRSAFDIHEVMDFKDVATQETLAAVGEVQTAHAARELSQVLCALQRVAERTYGHCIDCGDPIDPRRLSALPATAYCTACQAVHERLRD
jgi:DnaK suppressor protein